jgi:hypothetical protein
VAANAIRGSPTRQNRSNEGRFGSFASFSSGAPASAYAPTVTAEAEVPDWRHWVMNAVFFSYARRPVTPRHSGARPALRPFPAVVWHEIGRAHPQQDRKRAPVTHLRSFAARLGLRIFHCGDFDPALEVGEYCTCSDRLIVFTLLHLDHLDQSETYRLYEHWGGDALRVRHFFGAAGLYGCFSFFAARMLAAAVSFSHMYAPAFVVP